MQDYRNAENEPVTPASAPCGQCLMQMNGSCVLAVRSELRS